MNQSNSRVDAIRIALAEATHITHRAAEYRVISVDGEEIYAVKEDPCVEGEFIYAFLTVYGLLADRDAKIMKNVTLFTHDDYDIKKD